MSALSESGPTENRDFTSDDVYSGSGCPGTILQDAEDPADGRGIQLSPWHPRGAPIVTLVLEYCSYAT